MTRRRLVVICCAVAVLFGGGAVALLQWWPPPAESAAARQTVAVARGELVRRVRLTGVLESAAPTPIKTGVDGTLEWIAQDDDWVESGDRLYVLDVEEALAKVMEARTTLLGLRQELALERMRREHAEKLEEQKVDAARRAHELARIRHRILAAEPEGGERLIELHDELLPLEERMQAARAAYREAATAFQTARDAYLAAVDAAQEAKDALLYQQSRIDELRVRSEEQAEDDDATAGQRAADRRSLAAAEAAIAELREKLPDLNARVTEATAARDATRGPRDERRAVLRALETEAKELYIQLEIEKRALPLAKLELDREVLGLRLDQARTRLTDGEQAHAAGAISRTALEDLQDAVAAFEADAEVLDKRIVMAARPTPPEQLLEAKLEAERAASAAQEAEKLRDRALERNDRQLDLLEARIAKHTHTVEQQATAFPEVVESNIAFLQREREALDESSGDNRRRAEIDKRLAELRARLINLEDDPPGIGRSPHAGVVKLGRRWRQAYRAGDRVEAEDIVMQIFPDGQMEARAAVNETVLRDLEAGQSCRVTVPALENRSLTGAVARVSGVGTDKFAEREDEALRGRAGVVEFGVHITLNEPDPDLRPGMPVLVAIAVERVTDAHYLPLEAVAFDARGPWCRDATDGALRRIDGRRFDERFFQVIDGLALGEKVLVRPEELP